MQNPRRGQFRQNPFHLRHEVTSIRGYVPLLAMVRIFARFQASNPAEPSKFLGAELNSMGSSVW